MATAKRSAALKSLEKYRAKRDFSITAEPSGDDSKDRDNRQLTFCIQKHDASHLHYDFRLELDGVLKSWAVAKGPSFIPSERRLAVQVEDHPLSYGGFEGIIPQGQYGGGTVMLWDRGTWTPLEDPHAGLKKGAIKFELHGDKLTGKWTLVRMPPRPKDRNPNWLLIKEKDAVAKPDGPSLPSNDDESVLTKRSMEEIAGASDKVWQSGKAEDRKAGKTSAIKPKAKRSGMKLEFVQPELATLVETPPAGREWLHEIKFDGYRVIARIQNGKVTLFTRRGLDWTSRFPEIRDGLDTLAQDALIDGEIVVQKPDGTSDFSALQARLSGENDLDMTFFAFDLLHFDGEDLRTQPLIERKKKLQEFLKPLKKKNRIVYADHIEGSGAKFLAEACKAGLEGIIAKRADAPYRSGRIGDWLKIKCNRRQEFVIGGYVPPTTGVKGVGSLSVGYYKDGKLVYAGRIGTGYTEKVSRDLRTRLDKLATKTQPFAGKLRRAAVKDAVWVKPELVAEISFAAFTGDGNIRHGAFKGLREDKLATEVGLEEPAKIVPSPAHPSGGRPLPSGEAKKKARDEVGIAGVRISHPDKIIDEESGLTKLALAEYYLEIADWIMPHLAHRPISFVRCPDGNAGQCFYQRHIAMGMPESIHPLHLKKDGKDETYISIGDIKGLLSLVQFGASEIHPWGARDKDVDHPDRLIFDLDPDPSVAWSEVVATAFEVRDRLKKLKLQSFVKTTGGKGLHIVTPLDGSQGWDVIKTFAKNFAQTFADEQPDKFIAVMSKKDRKGKIFIDYLRNERSATAVAAYSTRARAGSPVATPLDWKELSADIDPHSFTTDSVRQRLKGLKADPWKNFFKISQSLPTKS